MQPLVGRAIPAVIWISSARHVHEHEAKVGLMPKFTVEIEYLLPIYHHVTVAAKTAEEACAIVAKQEKNNPIFWDYSRECHDGRSSSYIGGVWEGDRAFGEPVPLPDSVSEEARKALLGVQPWSLISPAAAESFD